MIYDEKKEIKKKYDDMIYEMMIYIYMIKRKYHDMIYEMMIYI